MNRSYTKIRKIQEANILLERRFLLNEVVNKFDKSKPNENQWYTAEDPKSVKNPKGWKIFVKQFGKNAVDPITIPEFEEFKNYFIEYNTQQESDTKFNEFFPKLIAKQENPQTSDGSTTTTTTVKPGTTPPAEGGTSGTSGTGGDVTDTEISRDDLINSMASQFKDTYGLGNK